MRGIKTYVKKLAKSELIMVALAFLILVKASGCSDDDHVLPVATGEGLNTFGCLVNGEIWLPGGNDGTANLDLSYDPGFRGGVFDIDAYKLTGTVFQSISIGSDSIKTTGIYTFNTNTPGAIFQDFNDENCHYYGTDSNVNGFFEIKKLDL